MFSQAGRETLIKAVALALPTYTMSVFKLPISICDEIKASMARFWWGGDPEKSKIHWRSWDALCRPKAEGGLTFEILAASTKLS